MSLFKGKANSRKWSLVSQREPPETSTSEGEHQSEHPYDLMHDAEADPNDHEDDESNIIKKENGQSQFSGIMKITFFFYQTASIIRIVATAKDSYHLPHIVGIILSLFNIRIDIVSGTDATNICPLNTSNPIKIELLRSSLPLISLAVLFFLMLLSLMVRAIRNAYFDVESESKPGLPFVRRVKGAYVNLLLLGYMSIAVFCFHAVNCVEIDGELYLYKKASIKCYQSWQKAIMVIIFLWIIPLSFCISDVGKCEHSILHRTSF